MKMKRLSELFSRSGIPGLAMLFGARHPLRRLLWAIVLGLCLLLTMHSLLEILREYLQYPITVNVLVSESRVLRFPAVTVCNLNPLHRGRFCRSQVPKPAALQQVLCASLDSLMQVCGVYELLDQLVTQGERICNAGNSSSRRKKKKKPPSAMPSKNTPIRRPNVNQRHSTSSVQATSTQPSIENRLSFANSSAFSSEDSIAPFEIDRQIKSRLSSRLNLNQAFWIEIERIMNENDLIKLQSALNEHVWNDADRYFATFRHPQSPEPNGDEQADDDDDDDDEMVGEENRTDEMQRRRTAHQSESKKWSFGANSKANQFGNSQESERQRSKVHDQFERRAQVRTRRQINYRTIFRLFHSLATGRFSSFKQILELLGITGESEQFFDNMIVQIAKFARIHINSTQDLIPALFLKSFADTTGCQIGASSKNSDSPNNIHLALQNLTKAFTNPKCILKLPRLFALFSRQSKNLTDGLYRCTGSWVGNLLKDELPPSVTHRTFDDQESNNKSIDASNESNVDAPSNIANEENRNSENSWYILLDILRSWIAELSRKHIQDAIEIGHQKHDLISSCYFAGKKCDLDKDLHPFFFSTYGNCYTYNFQVDDQAKQSLSGFTGPQFGLELVLNLETNEYMPTTREIGAKVMVHDPKKKADPEQDAVQIQPGVVTYVGVQMINISRAPAPYKDRCSDEWPSHEQSQWAKSAEHPTYTTQVCLKMCLQKEIIQTCGCWTLTAPGPVDEELPICNTRKNQTVADCTTQVRNEYYAKSIICNCPPRCSEEIYEKFVSTGKESRQCSALSADAVQEQSSGDDTNNYAKLLVYYQSLSYNAIQQSPKYTSETLVGAIGGILGVYLGFSFLAIYEFVEILVRSGYLLCFLPRPKSPEVASQDTPLPIIYTSESSSVGPSANESTIKANNHQSNDRKSRSTLARKESAARLYDQLYQMRHQTK